MKRTVVSVGLALVLAGEGSLAGPRVEEVQASAARTTSHKASWIRTGEEQEQANKAVRALLARPLTADAAAQIALLNNRSLQSRFATIGVSRADYLAASLPENPGFSTSVRFPDRPPSLTNIEYSIAQDILSLLLIPWKKQVASRELEVTKMRIASDVLGLVAETKTAFYSLQAQQQVAQLLQLTVESNESAADLAKRLHDAGNITELVLANQQALSSQARIDAGQALLRARNGREELNRLMGLWGADTNWKPRAELPRVPAEEISLTHLESQAIATRVDIGAARQRANSVGYALALKRKTRFLPIGLDLGVSTERETEGQRVTGPTLDVRLPIFNFGQATIARLEAQYQQARRDLEALAINARSEVREARDLIIASRDLAQYYETVVVPQRAHIVEQTQLQYNAMQIGPVELLTAK